MMKILVVGSGGREHALAWKFAQSPLVSDILVAPGNAGTAREPRTRNVAVAADDLGGLLSLAQSQGVDLTVVGPEQPLVNGIVDRFEDAGARCFGPRAAAARLEGSKAFAKAFLARYNIPTAAYETFDGLHAAMVHVRSRPLPVVIKADGLAAGKGVIIAETLAEAERALRSMLERRAFGEAGSRVVVEDYLRGEEASFIAVVDDTRIVALASSQDHKARDEGDQGPNTGGMGAYSPAPVLTPELHSRVMDEIMLPTVEGLSAEGMAYRGFLYAGLMIDPDQGPRVLEFNCRFGDPETQPVLARMRSDLAELCLGAFDGSLASARVEWDPRAALGVVMASGGYPGAYHTGAEIHGLDADFGDDTVIFHAGTRARNDAVITSGGRVLCVVALHDTVSRAAHRAYKAVDRIGWDDVYFRRDIGYRAIRRERA